MPSARLHSLAKKEEFTLGKVQTRREPKPELPLADRVVRPCASCVCRRAETEEDSERMSLKREAAATGGDSPA